MASTTTAISGKNGTLTGTPGTGDVGAEITDWNSSLTIEDLNATSMSSGGYYDNVEGIKKGTGSFKAIGQSTLAVEGTVTSAVFAVGSTTGQLTLTGDILISEVNITTPVEGDVVTFEATWVFRGSFARGTVA